MTPSADEKGHSQPPKPRRRRKDTVNLGQLMTNPELRSEIFLNAFRKAPEFAFLRKWGCPIQELVFEPRASEVLSRMYKLWPRLTPGQRHLYLLTAESIAEAEKAKSEWNPKASRARYARLAKNAVAAANLVKEISAVYPPPWIGEKYKIGELVLGLASFISGTFSATFPWERDEAVATATGLLRTAKKRIARRTAGMRWELLRDLVWLASGKRVELDERDVRRYLDQQRSGRNPAEAYLRPHWGLLFQASRLGKQWRAQPEAVDKLGEPQFVPELGEAELDSDSFRAAALRYLSSPPVSSTSG